MFKELCSKMSLVSSKKERNLCLTMICSPVFVHLRAVAPHKAFLGSFDQSCREITEFGLHLFLSALLEDVIAIQDVVVLTVGQFRAFLSLLAFELFFSLDLLLIFSLCYLTSSCILCLHGLELYLWVKLLPFLPSLINGRLLPSLASWSEISCLNHAHDYMPMC